MSISPIREAVHQLEALGLAERVPHQGAKVLDFDVDGLRDLFHVRLALESLAVRRGAERFTEAGGIAARRHLERFDEMRSAGDVRETMRAHTEFHFTLYEASQTPWLVSLIRPVWDRSERFRPALLASAGDPQDLHREFDERLVTACAVPTTRRPPPMRSTRISSMQACSSRPSSAGAASSTLGDPRTRFAQRTW